MDNEKKKLNKSKWTRQDKLALLKAIKIYGHANLVDVSKNVPRKSVRSIKAMINNLMLKSSGNAAIEQYPINNWLQCGLYKEPEILISRALLFIYLFETHPSLPKYPQYDFRAIYQFLYYLMIECTLPELSIRSNQLLHMLLAEVNYEVLSEPQCKVMEYIGKVYNKRNILRVYPGKKRIGN